MTMRNMPSPAAPPNVYSASAAQLASLAAVRKALDSTYVRMTVCFMQQELGARLGGGDKGRAQLAEVLDEVQTLLGKVR